MCLRVCALDVLVGPEACRAMRRYRALQHPPCGAGLLRCGVRGVVTRGLHVVCAQQGNAAPPFAELDPPTPSVAPTGKVRRMRPSPFHKASGVAASDSEDGDDENVPAPVAPRAAAAPRPARRAAAAASKYRIAEDSEFSDDGGNDEEDEDDEFELDSD